MTYDRRTLATWLLVIIVFWKKLSKNKHVRTIRNNTMIHKEIRNVLDDSPSKPRISQIFTTTVTRWKFTKEFVIRANRESVVADSYWKLCSSLPEFIDSRSIEIGSVAVRIVIIYIYLLSFASMMNECLAYHLATHGTRKKETRDLLNRYDARSV